MKFSFMLQMLGYFVLGCHALVLPTNSAELDIEIRIKSGENDHVSSSRSVGFPVKHQDFEQHVMKAVHMDENDKVKEIQYQEEWDEYVNTPDRLIILFFGAEWSGHSRYMRAVYSDFSNKYTDATFLYADIDSAEIYLGIDNIRVPSFFFFKNGNRVDGFSGPNPVKLEATIKAHI